MMVGRWVSFWDCLFLGAMLNFGGVTPWILRWNTTWCGFHKFSFSILLILGCKTFIFQGVRGIGPSEKQNDFVKALRIHVWYICHKIQSNVGKIYIHGSYGKEKNPVLGTSAQVPVASESLTRSNGGKFLVSRVKNHLLLSKKLFNMKNQASSINHLWIIYDSSWFYLIPFKYLCWLLVQVVCFSHFFRSGARMQKEVA